jgi:hypothetical protein
VFALLKQRRYSGLDLCPYVTFFEIYNSKVRRKSSALLEQLGGLDG